MIDLFLVVLETNCKASIVRFTFFCPAGAHLLARNGLVNEVEFLGLISKDQ